METWSQGISRARQEYCLLWHTLERHSTQRTGIRDRMTEAFFCKGTKGRRSNEAEVLDDKIRHLLRHTKQWRRDMFLVIICLQENGVMEPQDTQSRDCRFDHTEDTHVEACPSKVDWDLHCYSKCKLTVHKQISKYTSYVSNNSLIPMVKILPMPQR